MAPFSQSGYYAPTQKTFTAKDSHDSHNPAWQRPREGRGRSLPGWTAGRGTGGFSGTDG